MLLVDEDPGDAGQVVDRVQERARLAADDLHAVAARVCHEDPPAAVPEPGVGMVESGLSATRKRDEAGLREAHAAAGSVLTSFLHQAYSAS